MHSSILLEGMISGNLSIKIFQIKGNTFFSHKLWNPLQYIMQRFAGDIFQKNTIISLKSSNPFTVFTTNQFLMTLAYDIKDGILKHWQ